YKLGQQGIGSKAADVIDDSYSVSQAHFCNYHLLRIKRNGNAQFALKSFEHRQNPADLLVCADRISPGPRRLSAYVDNIRACLFQFERSLNRQLRIGKSAAGIEAVRRHIQDSHNEGALAKPEGQR